jgi:hypothetical protein
MAVGMYLGKLNNQSLNQPQQPPVGNVSAMRDSVSCCSRSGRGIIDCCGSLYTSRRFTQPTQLQDAQRKQTSAAPAQRRFRKHTTLRCNLSTTVDQLNPAGRR